MKHPELAEKLSASVIAAFSAGLLTREEALSELCARGRDLGFFTALEKP